MRNFYQKLSFPDEFVQMTFTPNILKTSCLRDFVARNNYSTKLGGTIISGEHGIGSKRKNFLHLVMQPELIDLMKRLKATFDPNNILNPGKIFPDS